MEMKELGLRGGRASLAPPPLGSATGYHCTFTIRHQKNLCNKPIANTLDIEVITFDQMIHSYIPLLTCVTISWFVPDIILHLNAIVEHR